MARHPRGCRARSDRLRRGGTSSSGSADKVVTTNGTEPQNPLLPGLTNENGGGKILTVLFSQLVRYETDGTAVLDVAESIEPNEDASEWTIKLHNDRKFSDGTPRPGPQLHQGLEPHHVEAAAAGCLLQHLRGHRR